MVVVLELIIWIFIRRMISHTLIHAHFTTSERDSEYWGHFDARHYYNSEIFPRPSIMTLVHFARIYMKLLCDLLRSMRLGKGSSLYQKIIQIGTHLLR